MPFGDEPRLQAQVVPLSSAGAIPTMPAAPAAPAAPVRALDGDDSEQKILAAAQRDRRILH